MQEVPQIITVRWSAHDVSAAVMPCFGGPDLPGAIDSARVPNPKPHELALNEKKSHSVRCPG